MEQVNAAPIAVPIIETSALGSYWKELRLAAQLTQEQLVAECRKRGLLVSVKQIWGWEKGQHIPSAPSKARVDAVLGGNPAVTDSLLLYDMDRKAKIQELQDIIERLEPVMRIVQSIGMPADETQAEQVAQYEAATKELNAIAEAAVQHGANEARAWIKAREHQRMLDEAVNAIPDELLDEAKIRVSRLYLNAEQKAREFLRYGRFLESPEADQ